MVGHMLALSKLDNAQEGLSRRRFLAFAALAATAAAFDGTHAQSPSVDNIPIIDAHIHLFDGTRPLGAGYMGSAAYRAISKTSLPSMYGPWQDRLVLSAQLWSNPAPGSTKIFGISKSAGPILSWSASRET